MQKKEQKATDKFTLLLHFLTYTLFRFKNKRTRTFRKISSDLLKNAKLTCQASVSFPFKFSVCKVHMARTTYVTLSSWRWWRPGWQRPPWPGGLVTQQQLLQPLPSETPWIPTCAATRSCQSRATCR